MSRSDRRALLLLALLGAAVTFGVWRLFSLRFTVGDVFPPYSSLRADPLGTKILFESLGRAGVSVERGFQPLALSRAAALAGTTVFLVGARRSELEEIEIQRARDLEGAAANGARLVIAYLLEREPPVRPKPAGSRQTAGPPRPAAEKPAPERISLPKRWGFRYGFAALRAAERPDADAATAAVGSDEDPALWHSTLVFADLDATWRVLGTRRGRAVLVEKDFGAGSIVLCADSYPLSNEAMLRDRRPQVLSRVMGANGKALFDEAHLGVLRAPGGVVSLLARFRLGGLALGIAVLAALALWRSASPFLPPPAEPEGADTEAAGRASTGALVDLLRRNIPAAELPAVCLSEWARTFPERCGAHPDRYERALAEAERCRTAKTKDPAGACRRIARILKGA